MFSDIYTLAEDKRCEAFRYVLLKLFEGYQKIMLVAINQESVT